MAFFVLLKYNNYQTLIYHFIKQDCRSVVCSICLGYFLFFSFSSIKILYQQYIYIYFFKNMFLIKILHHNMNSPTEFVVHAKRRVKNHRVKLEQTFFLLKQNTSYMFDIVSGWKMEKVELWQLFATWKFISNHDLQTFDVMSSTWYPIRRYLLAMYYWASKSTFRY